MYIIFFLTNTVPIEVVIIAFSPGRAEEIILSDRCRDRPCNRLARHETVPKRRGITDLTSPHSPSTIHSPAAHAIPPARAHAFYALVHLLAVALKVES